MRFLNTGFVTEKKRFRLKQFNVVHIPKYAILSHRWEEGEIVFRDVVTKKFRHKKAFSKLEGFCKQAAQDGYEWVSVSCSREMVASTINMASIDMSHDLTVVSPVGGGPRQHIDAVLFPCIHCQDVTLDLFLGVPGS
jgi:hypothetical protein